MSTDLEILRQGLRRREEEQKQALTGRRERAWQLARQAACLLRDEFGASRVVLYGSLVRPEEFHLRSDVDLAAWGVRDYLSAVCRLLDLDPEIEVNLVEYEAASPGLRECIRREGVEL
ncbi:MAG: nucleotidyltransferase domain-containing protein [Anaerolineae bacterium]|nr:nucleotidyltransferase domain-containing protein [Anaerolineae bacterium]